MDDWHASPDVLRRSCRRSARRNHSRPFHVHVSIVSNGFCIYYPYEISARAKRNAVFIIITDHRTFARDSCTSRTDVGRLSNYCKRIGRRTYARSFALLRRWLYYYTRARTPIEKSVSRPSRPITTVDLTVLSGNRQESDAPRARVIIRNGTIILSRTCLISQCRRAFKGPFARTSKYLTVISLFSIDF